MRLAVAWILLLALLVGACAPRRLVAGLDRDPVPGALAVGPRASVSIAFRVPGAARKIHTILATAQSYRIRIYEDSAGAYGTLLADASGAVVPGLQNTVTVDGLPAEKLLDFRIEVLDAGSAVVGLGMAQATLVSQDSPNTVSATMYAETPGLPGAIAGDLGEIGATFAGLDAGDSRVVAARLNLESGVRYRIDAQTSGVSCTPAVSSVAGEEGPILPGAATSDTSGSFIVTGSGGHFDVRTTFSGCAGGPTYTVRATRLAAVYTALGGTSTLVGGTPLAAKSSDLVYARTHAIAIPTRNWVYVFGGEEGILLEKAPLNADGTIGTFASYSGNTWIDRAAVTASGTTTYVIGGQINGSTTTRNCSVYREIADGTLTGDTAVGRLVVPRKELAAEVIGNYVYAFGGLTTFGAAPVAVERAAINANGTLSDFANVPGVSLRSTRNGHRSAIWGSNVYVFGGVNTIERAHIYADGTISDFETLPASFGGARPYFGSCVIGDYLYVYGGSAGPAPGVARARFNPDGTVSNFEPAPGVPLTYSIREKFVTVRLGDYVYALGGRSNDSDGDKKRVHAARIQGGELTTLSPLYGFGLTRGRRYHASVVTGNRIHVMGGAWPFGSSTSAIESAAIAPDGTLGGFTGSAGTTGGAIAGWVAFATSTRVYLTGGGFSPPGLVLVAPVDGSGNLGAFAVDGSVSLAGDRGSHAIAATATHAFVVGGYSGVPQVERAAINADGTLSDFEPTGKILAGTRYGHGAVIANGYLYAVGGSNGSTVLNTVERAPVGGDGTLGDFVPVSGVTLRTARRYLTSTVLGDSLYVFGGMSAAGVPQGTVERATIGVDGSLTNFQYVSGTNLVTARYGHTSHVIGDALYLLGGAGVDGDLHTIERFPLQ